MSAGTDAATGVPYAPGDGGLRMTRKKVLLVDRTGAVPSMAFLL